MPRPCLNCGTLIPKGSYCPACRPRNGSTTRWRNTRQQVLQRDGHQCMALDGTGNRCPVIHPLEVHHLQPLAAGGTDNPANLLTLCRDHHHQAGVKGRVTRWTPTP